MNKLIIAAAGSGKTSYLIDEALNIDEKVLITTFTNANEAEIRKKIIEKCGFIPKNINIQTWFTFLLQHGVRPFQGSMNIPETINGICMKYRRTESKNSDGRSYFIPKSDIKKYYLSKDMKIYSDKLSSFVFEENKRTKGKVINRIENIYRNIFIDEVQDMAGYDLEIINLLINSNVNLIMVGDPRQVTYHTHYEQKNKKYYNGKIENYIKDNSLQCIIDTETLKDSYRNINDICKIASELYPDMQCTQSKQNKSVEHQGVYFVLKKDILDYLEKYKPVQLRYNKRVNINEYYGFRNMGESKGLSFDRVLIYPTKKMLEWFYDSKIDLPEETRAKLYVALTRARFSVGIVIEEEKEDSKIKIYKNI